MKDLHRHNLEGCFYDDQNKFLFIHIFKNASISFRNLMNIRGNYRNYNSFNEKDIYKKIAIIRDPINRIVSIYRYLLKLVVSEFVERHPTHITMQTDFYKKRNNETESFFLFLKYVQKNGFYDGVCCPQIYFLKQKGISVENIDILLIQEKLQTGIDYYSNFYPYLKDKKIPFDNTSETKAKNKILEYIQCDKSVYNMIHELYYQDFLLYEMTKKEVKYEF